MNDGIMNTWEVHSNYDSETIYTCARKETAEYLSDWLQAIAMDYWITRAREDGEDDGEYLGHCVEYFVQEGEVIL